MFNSLQGSGGDMAPSLGGRTNFRGPRFLNDVFSGRISIFKPKNSDDLFFFYSSTRFFFIFPFFPSFFQILRIFTVLNVAYDPFFTFFYSVRSFACIRQRYFSKYWGRRMHGPPLLQGIHVNNYWLPKSILLIINFNKVRVTI